FAQGPCDCVLWHRLGWRIAGCPRPPCRECSRRLDEGDGDRQSGNCWTGHARNIEERKTQRPRARHNSLSLAPNLCSRRREETAMNVSWRQRVRDRWTLVSPGDRRILFIGVAVIGTLIGGSRLIPAWLRWHRDTRAAAADWSVQVDRSMQLARDLPRVN